MNESKLPYSLTERIEKHVAEAPYCRDDEQRALYRTGIETGIRWAMEQPKEDMSGRVEQSGLELTDHAVSTSCLAGADRSGVGEAAAIHIAASSAALNVLKKVFEAGAEWHAKQTNGRTKNVARGDGTTGAFTAIAVSDSGGSEGAATAAHDLKHDTEQILRRVKDVAEGTIDFGTDYLREIGRWILTGDHEPLTCENDGDHCEYTRTDCDASGAFNCQTHRNDA